MYHDFIAKDMKMCFPNAFQTLRPGICPAPRQRFRPVTELLDFCIRLPMATHDIRECLRIPVCIGGVNGRRSALFDPRGCIMMYPHVFVQDSSGMFW